MRNLFLLSSSLLFAACATSNPSTDPSNSTGTVSANEDSAQGTIDSATSASAEGDLMMSAIDGADGGGLIAAAVSAKLSANVSARFTPASCVTVTPGASALQVMFDDCTGPRGLVHVTGELDLTASISQGAITVTGKSANLQVNGAELTVDATATYAATATTHTITVNATSTGTGPHGTAVDHSGDYTISWDAATQCRSIDGQWSTTRAAGSPSTSADFSQCGGGCPTGSIAHEFAGGKTVTVTFDGTATASWTLTAAATATGSAGGGSGAATGSVLGSGTINLD
jgi:hypothetical protein